MIGAILEISIMLLGAFGLGLLAARQFFLPKLSESRLKTEEAHLQATQLEKEANEARVEVNKITEANKMLSKNLEDLKEEKERLRETIRGMETRLVDIQSDLDLSMKKITSLESRIQNISEGAIKPVDRDKVVKALESIKVNRTKEKEKLSEIVESPDEARGSGSYYETIDGKKYDKAVLDATRQAVAGRGDGRISMADAEVIFKAVDDANQYTDVEKETLKYIRENFNWTEASDKWFRKSVRSWAAKRGWESIKGT